MIFTPTTFKDVYTFKRTVFSDERGSFQRTFDLQGLPGVFESNYELKQANYSKTAMKGTFRGFHFQKPPFQEIKIVQVLKGKVQDILIDIRKDSPTFLKAYSVQLDTENINGLVIPKGIAHGFQTLEDDCELLYFHSEVYSKEHDSGLNVLDPALMVNLPLPITIISEKDKNYPFIDKSFKGY